MSKKTKIKGKKNINLQKISHSLININTSSSKNPKLRDLKQESQNNIEEYSEDFIISSDDSYIAYCKLLKSIKTKYDEQKHQFISKDRHKVYARYDCGNAKYSIIFSKKIQYQW